MFEQDEPAGILVIGAGASGAAFTWRLSEAGLDVMCLEQGSWDRPEARHGRLGDRGAGALNRWNHDPNVRRSVEDYPVRSSESPITPLMHNGVGGTTIHWSGLCERFHPSDFRVKTLDGVGDDWPVSYEEIEPYYDLNDRMMGCSGITGDPANPPRSPGETRPLPLGPDGLLVARAFDQLGWHWWPAASSTPGMPDEEESADAAPRNTPGSGREPSARVGVDTTYWPLATGSGARLRTRCRVVEITTGDDGRVSGAVYCDHKGNRRHQPARAVAVACNGIGTPRLLLASRSDRHPKGLANSTGLVGRRLMLHPTAAVFGLFEDDLGFGGCPPGTVLVSQEFYETNPRRAFFRGYAFHLARTPGPLAAVEALAPESIPWGDEHHGEFGRRFGRTVALRVVAEDLPELHNEVRLDGGLTDASGVPAPKVHYQVSRNTRMVLDHGIRNARSVLEAAGAQAVRVNPLLRHNGRHLMGTARMGDDPEASVLDRWGRAWDADNLFVIDGSAFVTSAAVGPTATIQALALRTADYIARERTDLRS